MVTERIFYTRPDGGVSVVVPSSNFKGTLNELQLKVVPNDASNVRQATVNELPVDRLFRDAWDDSNPEDTIGINVAKAKLLAHEMRRKDREIKLSPLDREEGFVTTTPQRKAEILADKQAIMSANAQVQTDIDGSIDEVATPVVVDDAPLRAVLQAAGLIS